MLYTQCAAAHAKRFDSAFAHTFFISINFSNMTIDKFPEPVPVSKQGQKIVLNEAQLEWLAKWYPICRNEQIREATGLKSSTLARLRRKNGISKTKSMMLKAARANGKKGARALRKNGYYDSLKGRKPTPAMIAGFQRYRESDNYLPTWEIVKRKNPRKYRQLVKKMSEGRKALFKSERLREAYGLPKKTKLRTTAYTRSQISHRYNALRRGYLLGDAQLERWCIFYDEQTERSMRFEKNLIKDGFKILPNDED